MRRLRLLVRGWMGLYVGLPSREVLVADVVGSFCDPPPGVGAIVVEVLDVEVCGLDVLVTVLVDPRDWVRQQVELGDVDVYGLLRELVGQLPREEVAELFVWLRGDPDLSVAVLSCDGAGGLGVDSWPAVLGF